MTTIKTTASLIAVGVIMLAAVGLGYAVMRYGTRRYAAGVQDGRNGVLADDARRAAQAQQHVDALAASSAAATDHLQQQLGTQMPAIESQAHASVETVRTIYRDRPVPAGDCRRPDGVQAALEAAIAHANAATGS